MFLKPMLNRGLTRGFAALVAASTMAMSTSCYGGSIQFMLHPEPAPVRVQPAPPHDEPLSGGISSRGAAGKSASPILSLPADPAPIARGYPVYVLVQNEGVVRGDASLNTATGVLSTSLDLETDRVDSGPIGNMSVELLGRNNVVLDTINVGQEEIGGKNPGKFREVTFSGQTSVSPALAANVVSISLQVQYLGQHFYPFETITNTILSLVSMITDSGAQQGDGSQDDQSGDSSATDPTSSDDGDSAKGNAGVGFGGSGGGGYSPSTPTPRPIDRREAPWHG